MSSVDAIQQISRERPATNHEVNGLAGAEAEGDLLVPGKSFKKILDDGVDQSGHDKDADNSSSGSVDSGMRESDQTTFASDTSEDRSALTERGELALGTLREQHQNDALILSGLAALASNSPELKAILSEPAFAQAAAESGIVKTAVEQNVLAVSAAQPGTVPDGLAAGLPASAGVPVDGVIPADAEQYSLRSMMPTPLSQAIEQLVPHNKSGMPGQSLLSERSVSQRAVGLQPPVQNITLNMDDVDGMPVPAVDVEMKGKQISESLQAIQKTAVQNVITVNVDAKAFINAVDPQQSASSRAQTSALAEPTGSGSLPATEGLAPSRMVTGGELGSPRAAVAANIPQATANSIRMMLGQGVNSATVNLNPPELGSMRINIEVKSDQLQVQIIATQTNTRESLEASLPRLRESLETEGFAGVNIDLGGGAGSEAQSEFAENDNVQFDNDVDSALENPESISVFETMAARSGTSSSGLIDLFA